jgi:hypothetical protein
MTSLFTFLVLLFGLKLCAQERSLTILPTMLSAVQVELEEQEDRVYWIPIVPVMLDEFYGEVRFNYDFENTLGVYAGKTFKPLKNKNHSVIPQVGVLVGEVKGASLQLYYLYETASVSVNFQNQYSQPFSGNEENAAYYYNWSSAGINVTKKFSVGLSAQLYCSNMVRYVDSGLYVSFRHKNFQAFLFDFNFYHPEQHFLIVGVQQVIDLKWNRR